MKLVSGPLIGRLTKNSMVPYIWARSPLSKCTAITPRVPVLLRLALMQGTISCGSLLLVELDWQPAVIIKGHDYHEPFKLPF